MPAAAEPREPYFGVHVEPATSGAPRDVSVTLTVLGAGIGHTGRRRTRLRPMPMRAAEALVAQLERGAHARGVPCPVTWGAADVEAA